ncbi:hypothetical protein [Allokutzneria oryzae]|uniref:Uncharacterized protein n=1 Tax=Allokutzneria oryzae TaxID=1378989 RepID=A0ABV5ZQS6_9PSEU
MRRALSAVALAALITATVSAPAASASTVRAKCSFSSTSSTINETGATRPLSVLATVQGGCKVTAKLAKRNSLTGKWKEVDKLAKSPASNKNVGFNFACHGKGKYRVHLSMSGDSATIYAKKKNGELVSVC